MTAAQAVKQTDDPLLAAWSATVARCGPSPAILDPAGVNLATFHDVEARARWFEADSELSRFTAGDVVAIQLGNHPDWPALFLACLRRSLVVLPLERSITERDRNAALRICHASGLVVATQDSAEIHRVAESSAVAWQHDVPVLLKLTSGTTSEPRAIRFQSGQLLADCRQICTTMGITDSDVNFGVIPVSHSYGFSNLLLPLIALGVPMVVSRDRMPRAVLQGIAATGATVFPGMPVFFQAFNEMPDLPPLPKLRLCVSAGAPLTTATGTRFRERFGLPVHTFYGSSECGGICYDRDCHYRVEGFVGPPVDGVRIELIEAEGSTSRIRVITEAAGDGYLPDGETNKLGRGVFVPDDLVSSLDGGFQIVGRASDLINVAGKKVNPAEIEAHLLRLPGVRQAAVFGRESSRRNQEVAACVVADKEVTEAEILGYCRRELSGWQVPRRIFFLTELPFNERGKLSRRDLAARFAT